MECGVSWEVLAESLNSDFVSIHDYEKSLKLLNENWTDPLTYPDFCLGTTSLDNVVWTGPLFNNSESLTVCLPLLPLPQIAASNLAWKTSSDMNDGQNRENKTLSEEVEKKMEFSLKRQEVTVAL